MIEEKIKNYPDIELLKFDKPVKSVMEAVAVSNIEKKHFIKTIIMKNKDDGQLIALILLAGSKVDKKVIRDGVGPKRWTFATAEEIIQNIGYPAGGVPPIFLPADLIKYVDPRVLNRDLVVGGGGTIDSLIKLPPRYIEEMGAVKKILSFG